MEVSLQPVYSGGVQGSIIHGFTVVAWDEDDLIVNSRDADSLRDVLLGTTVFDIIEYDGFTVTNTTRVRVLSKKYFTCRRRGVFRYALKVSSNIVKC